MSGLGAWVLIAVVVLILNRILTAAAGADRGGRPQGPVGRAGPPGSAAADEAAGARNPRSDATSRVPAGSETVVDLWRQMQATLAAEREPARAGRRPRLGPDRDALWMPGAAGGASLEPPVHEPRTVAPPAPAEPAAALRAETKGPTVVSARAATRAAPRDLPALPGRTPLQRAMIYATILGPPVALREEERRR